MYNNEDALSDSQARDQQVYNAVRRQVMSPLQRLFHRGIPESIAAKRTCLRFERTPLSALDVLDDFPNVERLDLTDCPLEVGVAMQYPQITELGLRVETELDLSLLEAFPNLTMLDIEAERCMDFSPIGRLQNLQALTIELENDATVDASSLADCHALTELSIRVLDEEDEAHHPPLDLSCVQDLPLESLDIGGFAVGDVSALSQCRTLREIELDDCLHPAGIESLAALPQLETLYLDALTCTDEQVEAYKAMFSHIEKIDIYNV